jgi:hypothetical protein
MYRLKLSLTRRVEAEARVPNDGVDRDTNVGHGCREVRRVDGDSGEQRRQGEAED